MDDELAVRLGAIFGQIFAAIESDPNSPISLPDATEPLPSQPPQSRLVASHEIAPPGVQPDRPADICQSQAPLKCWQEQRPLGDQIGWVWLCLCPTQPESGNDLTSPQTGGPPSDK